MNQLKNGLLIESSRFLRPAKYLFLDTNDNLIDDICIEEKCMVWHLPKPYMNERYPQFKIAFVAVGKKHCAAFERALDKLYNKIILTGHPEYADFCAEMIPVFEQTLVSIKDGK